MTGQTVVIAAAALLAATGLAWAQAGPSTSGAAGAAQSQGTTAAPHTSATPAAGAPGVGRSGGTTGTGLGQTGGLGGSPAAQTTVPVPPPSSAKP